MTDNGVYRVKEEWRCKETRMVKVIIQCEHGRIVCENSLRGCGCMFLAFTYKLRKKQRGMCYSTKYDMVEDGLMGRASEGNPNG
jgi:hypothetical protein